MPPINLLDSMMPGVAKEACFMLVLAALEAGLVMYLAQRLDAARKMEAQRDVIAQQQLCERDTGEARQDCGLWFRYARYTIKGGTGSGEVNTRFSYTIEQGLKNRTF